jgi:hypothetical protein
MKKGVSDKVRVECRSLFLKGMKLKYPNRPTEELTSIITTFERDKLYEVYKDDESAYLTAVHTKLGQISHNSDFVENDDHPPRKRASECDQEENPLKKYIRDVVSAEVQARVVVELNRILSDWLK